MITLHDTTRRQLALSAFGALCVLPTLAVLGHAFWWGTSAYVAAEANQLGRHLGLVVSIDEVRHPRPGQIEYVGLDFSDPETGVRLAGCQSLVAGWREVGTSESGRRTRLGVSISGAELDVDRAQRLGRLIERVLRREAGLPHFEANLSVGTLALLSIDPSDARATSRQLAGVNGRIETGRQGALVEYTFLPPDSDTSPVEPARVRWQRDAEKSIDTFAMVSGSPTSTTTLPCRLLALGWSPLARLGPESRFRGSFLLHRDATGRSQGGFVGELSEVDLATLLSTTTGEPTRSVLSARSNWYIESAQFADSRLTKLTGKLRVAPGEIERAFLRRVGSSLGLAEAGDSSVAGQIVPFKQIAVDFTLDSDGLTLWGQCSSPSVGAVLCDFSGPLLGAPLQRPQPTVSLVRALTPEGPDAILADPRVARLLGWLPIGKDHSRN